MLKTLLVLAFLLSFLIFCRLIYVLPPVRRRPARRDRHSPTHLLIVLGSGGHTAEMLYMLENALSDDSAPPASSEVSTKSASVTSGIKGGYSKSKLDWSAYTRRTWVVSSGDAFSALRAAEFEARAGGSPDQYRIVAVPRARRIHQPLWSAPWSCLKCGVACWRMLVDKQWGVPDLVLCNGPATATVVVFVGVLLRFLGVRGAGDAAKLRTIYVESWARIKGLSLSGKILCWVADRVLVQWEGLRGAGGRAEYHGPLCI